MPRRCGLCGRPLRDPQSLAAGLGPVCRRALYGPAPAPIPVRTAAVAARTAAVASAEQLALDLAACGELPATRGRRRRRGPIRDLPDIANYQPTETR